MTQSFAKATLLCSRWPWGRKTLFKRGIRVEQLPMWWMRAAFLRLEILALLR